MPSLSKATIIGHLGSEPEVRYSQQGAAILKFRVAVNTRRKAQSGEWEDKTEWFGVTAFGKTAEFAASRLKKGTLVYVDGRLESREWVNAEGEKRFFLDIAANEVTALSRDDSAAATSDDLEDVPL